MTLDEFQQAWKAESARVQVVIDGELLSQKVQQSQSAFRSMIFWRDVREVGVSLVMIPIWLAMGRLLSLPWTWYLTAPVFAWLAGFLLVHRLRYPHSPCDAGEPLSFYVKESLDQVEHQIRLLRNVFWWGLLPPSISVMAFFVQVGWESAVTWWGAVIGAVLVAGLGGSVVFYVYRWIYRLNQSVVRDHLEPRRDKLRELIGRLENGTNTGDMDEALDLIPAWSEPVRSDPFQANWSMWADNWNRIIPSWREVAIIIVPTLAGACCAWRFAVREIGTVYLGPTFFQAVVAAVIPFEIAFFGLWYRSYKRHQGRTLASTGSTRPKAPALVTIAMILVISVLAIAALVAFRSDQLTRGHPRQDAVSPSP